MGLFRRSRTPDQPSSDVQAQHADRLVRETEKAVEAQEAATESVNSVHAEALRLRDSHAVAQDLRRLIDENGWTERIALSMTLRKGGTDG